MDLFLDLNLCFNVTKAKQLPYQTSPYLYGLEFSGTLGAISFCGIIWHRGWYEFLPKYILKYQSFDNFFCIRSWLTTGKPFTQKRRVFLTLRYSPKDRHVHFFTSFWSNDTSLQKKGVDIPSWCCRNCWQAFAWMGRPVLFPQHKPWSRRTP